MTYRTYNPNDDALAVVGDTGFVGVDERDASQLGAGFVSEAVNYDFRNKVAEPRKGIVPLWWTQVTGAWWPWVWPVRWTRPLPFGAVYGACVYSDPNGREWIVIAADGFVYKTRQSNPTTAIPLNGNAVNGEVSFTQCFDVLLCFRGPDLPVLVMRSFSEGFVSVTQEANTISGSGTYNPTDGTASIPNADNGAFILNRLVVPHGRDSLAVSDFLNYTRYQPTLADGRINQGGADSLVVTYKFSEASLICFKGSSIYLLDNLAGDLSEMTLTEITREFGLVGAKAVAATGKDVWFLSQRGVTSIGQTEQNKLQGTKTTWSDPLQKTMRRINGTYSHMAAAAYFDSRFYLAVPLDEGKCETGTGTYTGVNNAILVYDFANDAWAGVWTGAGVMVKEWLKFFYNGKPRLGFVSSDGFLMLVGHSFNDIVRTGEDGVFTAPVETRLVTRGYTFGTNTTMGKFEAAGVTLSTWHPKFTIVGRVNGANANRTLVTDREKDREKYYAPFDRPDYDPTNANNDHDRSSREDYSVDLTTPVDLGSGIDFQLHQERIERLKVQASGRFCQLVVTNSQGRAAVEAVEVTTRAGVRRLGSV